MKYSDILDLEIGSVVSDDSKYINQTGIVFNVEHWERDSEVYFAILWSDGSNCGELIDTLLYSPEIKLVLK